jgi:hypothetical protein
VEVPWACHDLPATAFPFTIELVDVDSGEVAWSFHVTGPGAIEIPPVEAPRVVQARIRYADGTVAWSGGGR